MSLSRKVDTIERLKARLASDTVRCEPAESAESAETVETAETAETVETAETADVNQDKDVPLNSHTGSDDSKRSSENPDINDDDSIQREKKERREKGKREKKERKEKNRKDKDDSAKRPRTGDPR